MPQLDGDIWSDRLDEGLGGVQKFTEGPRRWKTKLLRLGLECGVHGFAVLDRVLDASSVERVRERVWVCMRGCVPIVVGMCGCVPIVVVGVDRMRDKDILAFLLCMKLVLTGARYRWRPGHRSRGRIPLRYHLVSLLLPPALTGPAVLARNALCDNLLILRTRCQGYNAEFDVALGHLHKTTYAQLNRARAQHIL